MSFPWKLNVSKVGQRKPHAMERYRIALECAAGQLLTPATCRSAERKPARIAVVGRDVVRTPPRCEAHRHLSAKPSGRTAGDVLQCSTDELRAGCASHIPHATGKTWPRTASAVWTVRCPAACSWRAVQLEGHRVGPKPTSLRRMKVHEGARGRGGGQSYARRQALLRSRISG